jgi:hypothetical protein
MSIRAMEQAHLNLSTFHQTLDLGVSNMIEEVTMSPSGHEPHMISYSQRDIDPKRYSRYSRTCTPSRHERLKESNHYSLFIKQKFLLFLEPKVLLPFTEVPRKAFAIQAEAFLNEQKLKQ